MHTIHTPPAVGHLPAAEYGRLRESREWCVRACLAGTPDLLTVGTIIIPRVGPAESLADLLRRTEVDAMFAAAREAYPGRELFASAT